MRSDVESDNERRVRAFWEQAFNGRDLGFVDAITAPDFVNHNALAGTPPGPEAQRQVLKRLWDALPDAKFEIKHLASDGATVICVGTMSGTHEGMLLSGPRSVVTRSRVPPKAWVQAARSDVSARLAG